MVRFACAGTERLTLMPTRSLSCTLCSMHAGQVSRAAHQRSLDNPGNFYLVFSLLTTWSARLPHGGGESPGAGTCFPWQPVPRLTCLQGGGGQGQEEPKQYVTATPPPPPRLSLSGHGVAQTLTLSCLAACTGHRCCGPGVWRLLLPPLPSCGTRAVHTIPVRCLLRVTRRQQ